MELFCITYLLQACIKAEADTPTNPGTGFAVGENHTGGMSAAITAMPGRPPGLKFP
jgi:hypothetical protein